MGSQITGVSKQPTRSVGGPTGNADDKEQDVPVLSENIMHELIGSDFEKGITETLEEGQERHDQEATSPEKTARERTRAQAARVENPTAPPTVHVAEEENNDLPPLPTELPSYTVDWGLTFENMSHFEILWSHWPTEPSLPDLAEGEPATLPQVKEAFANMVDLIPFKEADIELQESIKEGSEVTKYMIQMLHKRDFAVYF
jgi:hypothetical protein